MAYYHLGQEEKSIASYRKLIDSCPETLMANYYMGIALKAAGQYDEAILFFNKLLEKSDDHVSALYHPEYMKNFIYEKVKECFW
ncbi:MAG: tetratricopeptide repeat protein [Bacteroidales bacterium]|nr:tetratricopeptide repeat protein [Bacteroidales bacterium]